MATVTRRLKLRRDLKANIPALAEGEPFYCTDTHELFVGTATGNVKLDIVYSPAAPGFWAGTPPTDLVLAMDRIVAAVSGLLGGQIP